MPLHNVCIFSRSGDCIFSLNQDDPEKNKLLYGFLYSLKSFVTRIDANYKETNDYMTYTTSSYQLVVLELPTSYKIVLIVTVEPTKTNEFYKQLLKQFYKDIYVELVVKNPVIKPGSIIDSKLFKERTTEYYRQLD